MIALSPSSTRSTTYVCFRQLPTSGQSGHWPSRATDRDRGEPRGSAARGRARCSTPIGPLGRGLQVCVEAGQGCRAVFERRPQQRRCRRRVVRSTYFSMNRAHAVLHMGVRPGAGGFPPPLLREVSRYVGRVGALADIAELFEKASI
jgi:hypothetical protein